MDVKAKYALRLGAVFKEAIWGGHALADSFGIDSGLPRQAEAWELTVRGDGMNVIENGICAGMTLGEYLEGGPDSPESFPLLVKYIDAGEKLSIQVHPAKTEFWHIVAAKPGAWLIYGQTGDYSEGELRKALGEGRLEDCLRKVYVKAGESYFIPTGLTHAIGPGILIAEIQENSNVTYRVYDYDRIDSNGKKRELHTDKAFSVMKNISDAELDALRFSKLCEKPLRCGSFTGTSEKLASCDKFTVYRHSFTGDITLDSATHFTHIMCIGGRGTIDGESVKGGDTFFIPRGTGDFTIRSDSGITALESFVL